MSTKEIIKAKRKTSNFEAAAKVLGWESHHNTQGSFAGMITFQTDAPIGHVFSFDVREDNVVEDTMQYANDFDEDMYSELLLQARNSQETSPSQIVQTSKDIHSSLLRLAETFDRMQQKDIDLFEDYIHSVMNT